jgi:SAM-dependent methyltransferase
MTTPAPPPCPITGLPPVRLIETLPVRLLIELWRYSCRVDAARHLDGVRRLRLWESPCGIAYWEPMIAGDKAFYDDLYGRLGDTGPWRSKPAERSDYSRAAGLIAPGERVLDVGCGNAGFARHVPQARYVGLEQSPEARKVAADVRAQTIADHAAAHAGEYDVVCSFHAVEHVADPAQFVADMLRCLRPGGRFILAAPSWPSAMTDVPNFVANAPPHHLTWWTEGALKALAGSFGLSVETAQTLPASPALGLGYWMGWMAPKVTGTRFFRHAWSWHLGLLWSWLAGSLCYRLFDLPAHPHSLELLLVARKPGG